MPRDDRGEGRSQLPSKVGCSIGERLMLAFDWQVVHVSASFALFVGPQHSMQVTVAFSGPHRDCYDRESLRRALAEAQLATGADVVFSLEELEEAYSRIEPLDE